MNDQFSPHFWQLIVECIQHKSHDWKYAFISKGGRHTLIQATLQHTYLLPISFCAPADAIKGLDKLVRDFFWEGSCGKGGMHNVNWEIVQQPKLIGGTGVGNFHHCNSTL